MVNVHNRILKISALIIILSTFTVGVSAQDISATFNYIEPVNNSDIPLTSGNTASVNIGAEINPNVTSKGDVLLNGNSITGSSTIDLTANENNLVGATVDLEPGSYTAEWEAFTSDDFVISDTINFKVVEDSGDNLDVSINDFQFDTSFNTVGGINDVAVTDSYIAYTDSENAVVLEKDTGNVLHNETINGSGTMDINEIMNYWAYDTDDGSNELKLRELDSGNLVNEFNVPGQLKNLDLENGYLGYGTFDVNTAEVIDLSTNSVVFSETSNVRIQGFDITDDYIILGNNDDDLIYYDLDTFSQIDSEKYTDSITEVEGNSESDTVVFNDNLDAQINIANYTTRSIFNRYNLQNAGQFQSHDLANSKYNFVLATDLSDLVAYNNTEKIKTFNNAGDKLRAVDIDTDTIVFGGDGGQLYKFSLPGLTLDDLRYGNYNFDSGSLEETNSFVENETFQARVNYSQGSPNDCLDIYMRPQSGWNPIPAGFNSDEWASFGRANCLSDLETNYVGTPIFDVIQFPLNQSGTYEIFAGGFDASLDPSSLASKDQADVSTVTETFEVILEGAELDSNILIGEPLDGATYSYDNATNGIPWDISVIGNKENVNISWTVTADNNQSDVVYQSGFTDANITGSGFTANGDFTIPDFYHDDGEPFTFTVEVTDGFSTQSGTSSFTLSDTFQAPDDGTNGDGDTPTDGFLSEFIGTFFGGIADVFDVIDQNAKDSFGSAGIQAISVLLSFGVGFLIFIGSAILEAPSEPLAFLGFVASIGVFTSVGWISPWLIVGSMIAIASLGLWYIFN